MFGPLADGIAKIIELILTFAQVLIVASMLISWLDADPNNNIVRSIQAMSEPLIRPFRRLTKSLPQGPLDWAPTICLLTIVFLQMVVVPYIRMFGHGVAG